MCRKIVRKRIEGELSRKGKRVVPVESLLFVKFRYTCASVSCFLFESVFLFYFLNFFHLSVSSILTS